MRIDGDLHALVFRTPFFAPDPRETKEESLLWGVAINLLAFFSGFVVCDHVPERRQSNACPTVIGGVFAERESAIELEIVNRDKIAVLIGDTTDALFKLLAIFGRPPVVQVALRIVLASLVVKTVGQLVSDHQPNAAEVHGIVHVLFKERRLQNAGGK